MRFCSILSLVLLSWLLKPFKTVGLLFKKCLCIKTDEDKLLFTSVAILYPYSVVFPSKLRPKKNHQIHLQLLLYFESKNLSKSLENGAQNGWSELRTTTLGCPWPPSVFHLPQYELQTVHFGFQNHLQGSILGVYGGHTAAILTDKRFCYLYTTQIWRSYAQDWFRCTFTRQRVSNFGPLVTSSAPTTAGVL